MGSTENVTLLELASTPLILPTRGRWFSDIVSPVLKQADLEFNIRFELSGYAAIMQLVSTGAGVASSARRRAASAAPARSAAPAASAASAAVRFSAAIQRRSARTIST